MNSGLRDLVAGVESKLRSRLREAETCRAVYYNAEVVRGSQGEDLRARVCIQETAGMERYVVIRADIYSVP